VSWERDDLYLAVANDFQVAAGSVVMAPQILKASTESSCFALVGGGDCTGLGVSCSLESPGDRSIRLE